VKFTAGNHNYEHVEQIKWYILGEIGTETTELDTRKKLNRRESDLWRCQTGADIW